MTSLFVDDGQFTLKYKSSVFAVCIYEGTLVEKHSWNVKELLIQQLNA